MIWVWTSSNSSSIILWMCVNIWNQEFLDYIMNVDYCLIRQIIKIIDRITIRSKIQPNLWCPNSIIIKIKRTKPRMQFIIK